MELKDFIVTPIVILLVFAAAYMVRPLVTDFRNRRYFLPALTVRIVGALALGFVYQFYYQGGDTFNYHTHGSRIIWNAFTDDPLLGIRMIFGDNTSETGIYSYSSRIIFFHDPSSYFVVRLSALLDLLTFSSYTGTAILFAVLSFSGSWAFFLVFYKRYPEIHLPLALAALFVPSLSFWSSGILKETVVIGALGFATYFIDQTFIQKRRITLNTIFLVLSLILIFEIKKFILQAFVPSVIMWLYIKNLIMIRSTMLRMLVFPVLILLVIYLSYSSVVKIGEGDKKYSVEKIAETAKITAFDIGFYTGRNAGSGYSLGDMDGTIAGMVSKAPAAVNVSLFRPYIWEVRNPLMLLAAGESLLLLIFVIVLLFTRFGNIIRSMKNPDVIFALTFSITMAFAVGVTSYNFGTLSRYRTPLIPFLIVGLILIYHQSNRERNVAELELTE